MAIDTPMNRSLDKSINKNDDVAKKQIKKKIQLSED